MMYHPRICYAVEPMSLVSEAVWSSGGTIWDRLSLRSSDGDVLVSICLSGKNGFTETAVSTLHYFISPDPLPGKHSL